MNEQQELNALRVQKQDWIEREQQHEEEYQSQLRVNKAMQQALNQCSNALWEAENAISAFVEIKKEEFKKTPMRKRGGK